MIRKKLLLAGMTAALTLSAATLPAYAAGTDTTAATNTESTTQSTASQQSEKSDSKMGQPGRKSDEEAMKEGNAAPDLPDGVTAQERPERPEGDDGTQTPPEKPEGDDGTQTPPEKPEGSDDTQTPPEKPEGDNENGGQNGETGQPAKKSDEDAMKESNAAPELPQGVSVDNSSNNA